MGESNYCVIKKINDSVWLYEFLGNKENIIELRHDCALDGWSGRMALRDNDAGPVYWCCNCGYILENGEAMAVRLYEAKF